MQAQYIVLRPVFLTLWKSVSGGCRRRIGKQVGILRGGAAVTGDETRIKSLEQSGKTRAVGGARSQKTCFSNEVRVPMDGTAPPRVE